MNTFIFNPYVLEFSFSFFSPIINKNIGLPCYFCWPWRFPLRCSAAGIVWKRWPGSLWTAISRVVLPCRRVSGDGSKNLVNLWVGKRTENRGRRRGEEMRGENGKREKRRQRSSAGSFFTGRGRDSLSSRINVLYWSTSMKKRFFYFGGKSALVALQWAMGNVKFTKKWSILQHTGQHNGLERETGVKILDILWGSSRISLVHISGGAIF